LLFVCLFVCLPVVLLLQTSRTESQAELKKKDKAEIAKNR
jgi:hypothetical protein